jgi:hypothetical protein
MSTRTANTYIRYLIAYKTDFWKLFKHKISILLCKELWTFTQQRLKIILLMSGIVLNKVSDKFMNSWRRNKTKMDNNCKDTNNSW